MNASEVQVSREALRANFRAFARRSGGPSRIVPVLKANAYGHSAELVARTLAPERPRAVAVAHASEAVALREHVRGRILVLSAWNRSDALAAARVGAELVAWDRAALRVLSRMGTRRHPVAVHLKLDSGTGRLGTRLEEAAPLIRAARSSPGIRLAGVFTHFADAEEEIDGFTLLQLRRFLAATAELPREVERHAACTASVLRFPRTRLDFVRLGLGLYGLWPSPRSKRAGMRLRPALRWETTVQQVKVVPRGTTVGYGRSFRARRLTRLALLPVGYADGYPRSLSNTGVVRLEGRLCPVAGRVSMNLTVVDATGTEVRPGARAMLLGGEGRGFPGVERLSGLAGTISYELTTRIAAHVPRRAV